MWEYHVKSNVRKNDPLEFNAWLNKVGSEGWELTAIEKDNSSPIVPARICTFKRRADVPRLVDEAIEVPTRKKDL